MVMGISDDELNAFVALGDQVPSHVVYALPVIRCYVRQGTLTISRSEADKGDAPGLRFFQQGR